MQPEPQSSLSNSMDNAKKHYSSLFSLPSYERSLTIIAGICLAGITLTAYAVTQNILSLALGFAVFAATVLTDLLVSKTILHGDPIFIMRRTSAISFVGWLIWIALAVVGAVLGSFLGWMLWVKLVLLGFAAVVTLRSIVVSATSTSSKPRQILSILLQPALCIAIFLGFWTTLLANLLPFLPFIVMAPVIGYTAVYLLLNSIDRLGKTYQLPSMPLFRAFILNWVIGQNGPLETHLEAMGEDADINVSLLKFEAAKPQAAIIVPLVHPGPFSNIGSSLLPSMLKHDFEAQYGCPACTPLGILGHELDLASQAQNRRIVTEVLSKAKFQATQAQASAFTRETDGAAIASCQIFGDTALLSFSLAPNTTEDLPQELGRMVEEEAKQLGLNHAIVVNSHNCLTDVDDTKLHIAELECAAKKCLQTVAAQPKKPFKVGSASVFPDFTQKQGMGTGGITAIAVEVTGQKTVYIIIDGNNMVPHLREKILDELAALGFSESEVFTTDTHAVSGIVTGKQGYHPIGEAIDHTALIRSIKEAAQKALQNLDDSKAGFFQFVVPDVRVIGEERLDAISNLVDKAIHKAKKVAAPIFGGEALLLVLLLFLL